MTIGSRNRSIDQFSSFCDLSADLSTDPQALSCKQLKADYGCKCDGCVCKIDQFLVKCGSYKNRKDAKCDDENNNLGCGWDGGDCCGNQVDKSRCKKCQCLDPNKSTPGICGAAPYKGDDNCDDENNNKVCAPHNC